MKSLRKLLPYIKPYMMFAILGPLLMCIEVGMDLLQPTIMQHIIDVGIADNDNGYVLKLGLLMILTAFVGLIGGEVRFIVRRQLLTLLQIYAGMCSRKQNNSPTKIQILLVLEN